LTITQSVKTMQEQNEVFRAMEPNIYKRVALMAADIKQATQNKQQRWQQKRKGTQPNASKWYHR